MTLSTGTTSDQAEEARVLAAVRDGDASAFAALAERYRRQLHVHCYRMLGSVDDADDLVQETFLRAWRGRANFEARSLFRTWLYRIATNACLNVLERAPRRVMPQDVAQPVTATSDATGASAEPPWAPELPWLQPYPDQLLEPAAPREMEPDAVLVSRETVELVYLAAIQHLPPRQRAILILRDALDWSAKETAALLDTSLQSVNSALQRARSTMRTRLPTGRLDETPPVAAPTDQERVHPPDLHGRLGAGRCRRADRAPARGRAVGDAAGRAVVRRARGDREAVRAIPHRLAGRRAIGAHCREPAAGRCFPLPGSHGESAFPSVALNVLRIENGKIAEITTFSPSLLRAFGLPPTL